MEHELNRDGVIDFVEARNRLHLGRKRLEIDVARYQSYLDDSNLSEKAKDDFVQSLWTVIVAFVDLGYGIHPTQSEGSKIIAFPTPSEGDKRTATTAAGAPYA